MKDVLVRAGSSVLAAAVGYILLTVFAESLGTKLKLVVAAALGLCALGVAVWAARRENDDTPGSLKLASNLKGASAQIEDLRAELASGATAKVASEIETDGPIEIRRAAIHSAQEK
jgi:hypothetical protein